MAQREQFLTLAVSLTHAVSFYLIYLFIYLFFVFLPFLEPLPTAYGGSQLGVESEL